ncbi:MAG: DUF805 domain-containing protein [Burkholderiaceae bacterium]
MNIQRAVQTCFRKYVDFSGRASRPEYWWFFLAYFVVAFVGQLINRYIPVVIMLAVILPLLAVTVRRLHDIGKSGWMILIGLIPILGILVLIYLYVQPSQPGINRWGSTDMSAT